MKADYWLLFSDNEDLKKENSKLKEKLFENYETKIVELCKINGNLKAKIVAQKEENDCLKRALDFKTKKVEDLNLHKIHNTKKLQRQVRNLESTLKVLRNRHSPNIGFLLKENSKLKDKNAKLYKSFQSLLLKRDEMHQELCNIRKENMQLRRGNYHKDANI